MDPTFINLIPEIINNFPAPVIIADENKIIIWKSARGKEKYPDKKDIGGLNIFEVKLSDKTYFVHLEGMSEKNNLKAVAHDFNNIFSTVLNTIDLLIETSSIDESGLKHLENIETNIYRASDITSEALQGDKEHSPLRKKIEINKFMKEFVESVKNSVPPRINFIFTPADEDMFFLGNKNDLYRVMLNLVVNAVEAIEKSGVISLSVMRENITESGDESSRNENYLHIKVKDSGIGINSENLDKVFSYGFSTKIKKQESGLGLHTCKNIIEKHSGRIEVSSSRGKGTEFDIFIPEQINNITKEKGKTKILIADDEESVIELLTELLEYNNYEVIQASDGYAALRLLKKHPDIDLVVIDKKMPRLNGVECIRQIREMGYKIPVILASGTYLSEKELLIKNLDIDRILKKPYNFDEMQNVIGELLKSGS